jgi:hypothetical protein
LDFRNATNADPNLNMPYSASINLLSRQYYLTFQLLGLPRAIGQHDEDGAAISCFPIDAIQFGRAKARLSDGGSFKMNLYATVNVSLIMM